jgi:SOS-response transcriptional repressor LexA
VALIFGYISAGNNSRMNSTAHRRAKVTPETMAEAARLRALWQTSPFKLSQAAFGERYEIGSQPAVGFFLNGDTPLSLKAAQGFAKGLQCDIADFSPRLASKARGIAESVGQPPEEFVEVKRVNVTLAAGTGALGDIYEEIGSLSFRRDFLAHCGVTPASARIVNVKGTSMEPTIPDGSVLLINRANTEPVSGKVFALAKGSDGLVVKRLVKIGRDWYARSDNPDGNPDFLINDDEPAVILGRAVWMGTKL